MTWFDPNRWAMLAAAAACLLILTTAVIPATRAAIWEFIDLPGIRIEVGNEDDPIPTAASNTRIFLGGEVDPETLLGFSSIQVRGLPISTDYGLPTCYLDSVVGSPVISLVYGPTTFLPEIGTSGAGLVLMQFPPTDLGTFFVKKSAEPGRLYSTFVNGKEAWWIEEGEFSVLSESGEATLTRPSANVLIWFDNGATYRMESSLDREASVALAESLVPLSVVFPGT